nr:16S rRNA (cytidine(1402)-2'-O)-methyltransferase [Saprospiraceae bacterium]
MLYLIPTPIGNLKDITFRAVDTIGEVDYLLVEDTRTTGKLLKHLGLSVRMVPFHAHNEHQMLDKVIADLQSGLKIGLLSDAGSPGLSDPGFLLIRACRQLGLDATALPGPSAAVTAAVASGIPCDKFFFEGFLPHKKGRKSRLEYLSKLPETFLLFESPYRLVKCLGELITHCGPDRKIAVCRELTKMYEEVKYGTAEEIKQYYDSSSRPRGEIVIVVDGNRK